MGRNKKITEKAFKSAYKKCESVPQMASLLGVSIPTIYNCFNYYKVTPYSDERNTVNPLTLATKYRMNTTISALAKRFSLTIPVVRYHLNKVVLYPKRYPLSKEFPPPQAISDIKIICTLMKDKSYLDHPKQLRRFPGLNGMRINKYWRYAFGFKAF